MMGGDILNDRFHKFTLFIVLFMISLIILHPNTSKVTAQEWKLMNPTFEKPNNINVMNGFFLDSKIGWLVSDIGDSGRIYRTTNGGKSWKIKRTGERSWISIIKLFNYQEGIFKVKTFHQPYEYYLLKTNNGGDTWQKIATPGLNTITFFDKLNGYAVGNNELYRTENGGLIWFTTDVATSINTIIFLDENNGFAGGYRAIYKTNDGGFTWIRSTVETEYKYYLNYFYFIDKNHGWAIGTNTSILTKNLPLSILFSTSDGGNTWQVQIEYTYPIRGIYFASERKGIIVGYSTNKGEIQITHDGGKTWALPFFDNFNQEDVKSLHYLKFFEKNKGFAVGSPGIILKTEDVGNSWQKIKSGTAERLSKILFVENDTIGFIFGDNKTLLRYGTGMNGESRDIPIAVIQNYPNPFNNSTTFWYDLYEGTYIEIGVFDVTGRLVKELFVGYQDKGRHPFTWTPQNVSSGVYFFRVKTSKSTKIIKGVYLN